MNAVVQLSLKERSDIRRRVFDDFRGKPTEVLEILAVSYSWHKLLDDGPELSREINRLIDHYLEHAGFYADAEREELEARSRG